MLPPKFYNQAFEIISAGQTQELAEITLVLPSEKGAGHFLIDEQIDQNHRPKRALAIAIGKVSTGGEIAIACTDDWTWNAKIRTTSAHIRCWLDPGGAPGVHRADRYSPPSPVGKYK